MRLAFVLLGLCLLSLLFVSVNAQQSYNASECNNNGASCPTGGSCTRQCTGSSCTWTCRYSNCVSTATIAPNSLTTSSSCSSSSSLSSGASAGISIVVVVVLIAAMVGICYCARCCCFSYRQREENAPFAQPALLLPSPTQGYAAPVFPGSQPPMQQQQPMYGQQPVYAQPPPQYGQQPPQQHWAQPGSYQPM